MDGGVSLPFDVDVPFDEEQVERLHKAMEKLRPDERAILLLAYDEERPTAEIATIMRLSEGNVRTRLSRLHKKLFVFLSHDP